MQLPLLAWWGLCKCWRQGMSRKDSPDPPTTSICPSFCSAGWAKAWFVVGVVAFCSCRPASFDICALGGIIRQVGRDRFPMISDVPCLLWISTPLVDQRPRTASVGSFEWTLGPVIHLSRPAWDCAMRSQQPIFFCGVRGFRSLALTSTSLGRRGSSKVDGDITVLSDSLTLK